MAEPRMLRTSSVGRMFSRMRRHSATAASGEGSGPITLEETAEDRQLAGDRRWLAVGAERTAKGITALEEYSTAAQAFCEAIGLAGRRTTLLVGAGDFVTNIDKLQCSLADAAGRTLVTGSLAPLQARRTAQQALEERLAHRVRLRAELLHYKQKVAALHVDAQKLEAKRGENAGAAKKADAAQEKLARNVEKCDAAAENDRRARDAALCDIATHRVSMGSSVRGSEMRQLDLVHGQAMGVTTARGAAAGAAPGGLTPNEEAELKSLEVEAGVASGGGRLTGCQPGSQPVSHRRSSSGRSRPAPPTAAPPLPPDGSAGGVDGAAAVAAVEEERSGALLDAKMAAGAAMAAAPQSAAAAFGSPSAGSWSMQSVQGTAEGKALFAAHEEAFHRSMSADGPTGAGARQRCLEHVFDTPAGGNSGARVAGRSPKPLARRGSAVRRISITKDGAPPPPPGRPRGPSVDTPAVPNSRRRSFAAETAGITEL